MGLMFSPLAAQLTGSLFENEVSPSLKHSLLFAPNALYKESFVPATEGLSHPFKSLGIFGDAVLEVFEIGQPESALFSYRHPLVKADLNLYAGYEANLPEKERYGFLYKGWKIKANIIDRLYLSTDWYNGAFGGNLDKALENTLIDAWHKRADNHISYDNLQGELAYKDRYFTAALGRGRFQIGNGISGSIVLSDYPNDYGYFRTEAQLGDFRLSLLHASLIADSLLINPAQPFPNNNNYPDKFIALHQLSWYPCPKTEFYMGESVVYGNRGIDINYLLPNSFWRATEHNLGDRDNVMIYAGLNQRLSGTALLYGQIALDEFSYGKVFSHWWGNKYALKAGIAKELPFIDLCFEATAVRPYTYAHFTNHTMYSHDGRSLGYPKGSNILNFSLQAEVPIKDYASYTAFASYSLQGSKGNDWKENYHETFAGVINTAEAHWLEGDRQDRLEIFNRLYLPLFKHHKLLFGHDAIYQDESWRQNILASWQIVF